MIGVLLSVLLSGPMQKSDTTVQIVNYSDECAGQIVCPFTSSGRVCVCAGPVISLGAWDPRESPAEWSRSNYGTPASFGAYPTEQKSAKTEIRYFGAE